MVTIHDRKIWELLEKLDRDLALKSQAVGGENCGDDLHRADYARKPRAQPQWNKLNRTGNRFGLQILTKNEIPVGMGLVLHAYSPLSRETGAIMTRVGNCLQRKVCKKRALDNDLDPIEIYRK